MSLVRRFLLIAATAALVVACGESAGVDGRLSEFAGSVYAPPGVVDPPEVLVVGLLVVDSTAVAPTSVFNEIESGVFVGAFAPVVDGAYAIPAPDEADLPDGLLVPAAMSLLNVVEAGCTLAASPSSARVSQLGVQFIFPVPLLVGLTLDGFVPMITTSGELEDGVDFEGRLLSWVYADRAVSIATTDACVGFDVDLELRSGWNQVGWTFDDPVQRLRDAPDDTAFSTTLIF